MTNPKASFDSMSPDAPPPSTDAEANDAGAIVQSWLVEPLAQDVKLAIDRLARSEDVARIAVMPDVHLASGVCVGNVVATTRLIYSQAVGSDIGCGMAAVAFAASADVLRRERHARRLLEALPTVAPAMRHRSLHVAPPLPDDLTAEPLTAASLGKESQREGRVELGTLGRGNHFVEFQADEEDRLWLMVHSGSRHMGQAIHLHHTRNATRVAGGLCHLDATTDAGQAYLADVAWARRYADANRRRMIDAIAELLQTLFNIAVHGETLVTCDHNHVRRESHGERDLWVHRKGAMPADDGLPGVLPGTMETHSFHVVGRGCAAALRSSSHGAGRAMSRSDARRRIGPNKLARQLDGVYFDERLLKRLCEEAPAAYKDIDAVLRAQRELTRTVRKLTPVLVYKGV